MGIFRRRKHEEATVRDLAMLLSGNTDVRGGAEALKNSSFWACVMLLARQEATLPIHAYAEDSNGVKSKLPKDHYLNMLLHHPHPGMTGYQFRFFMALNFELHGQACAILKRGKNGLVTGMYPVSPSQLVAVTTDGCTRYTLTPTHTTYDEEDILFIHNTPNGYTSVLSPVAYAQDEIDLEDRCKTMQRDYFKGSSYVGNIIKTPKLKPEARAELKAMFDSMKGFKNIVVEEGINVTPLQVAAGDVGRLIEASSWSSKEVAKRFGIMPFFIGDAGAPMANTEQQGIVMNAWTLGPRLVAWEEALSEALCASHQYIKFNMSGLARGDMATRGSYYNTMIMNGIMSIDEIRALEDLPPIGKERGGNEHFFPLNYGTAKGVADGIYNQNPWNAESKEGDKLTEDNHKETLEEKKKRELKFVEDAKRPAKTSRKKLEKLIRDQLKKEIAKLRELIATGQPTDHVLKDWTEWLNANAKELAPMYKALYIDVIKRMLPTVRKQTGLDTEVADERIDGFAGEYAASFLARHDSYVHARLKATIDTDNFEDSITSLSSELPITESEEEVTRTAGAFSVFLYSALGVTYMHSVAQPDACAFCSKLDGKVCSVNGYILAKGDDVSDGEGYLRHIDKNYRHPPYHTHCSCFMAPGE